MKKSNKKKILGIMSKLGNFINKAQPIVGDIPPEKDPDENQPKKEEAKPKKEVKKFNLQIEDDEKAEYDLNDDDDDEEEEEEEDDDNEEKDKNKENENNEESTNNNDSSIEKKDENKKEEIKEEKKEEIKQENNKNIKEEKKENNDEKIVDKENKEIKKEEQKEEKKEKDEIKQEKKIEEKKDEKKEVKKEEKKEEIKEDKKIKEKKETNKKEETKEIKTEKKEESTKKKETIQKPKKASKPLSKSTHSKKPVEVKIVEKKEETEAKQNQPSESPSIPKDKPKIKFQKKQKVTNKNKICHYFLKKGTDIDIKEYEFYCVKKIKKQKSMFSKLNNFGINLNLNIKFGSINKVSNKLNSFFKKKPKDIKYTDYYLIMNEHFIYFCRDAEIFVNEPDKKRIGSIVPFNNITKIEINQEGDLYKINFEIQFRTLNKNKEFYVDNEIYGELLQIFKEFKKIYNLDYTIDIKEN